jgi:hypothetical protein
MNKSALREILQALNAIRIEIEHVNKNKWVALELMLSTSDNAVALATKMAKTVIRIVTFPKFNVIKQLVQQISKTRCERRCSNCNQFYHHSKAATQSTNQLISI